MTLTATLTSGLHLVTSPAFSRGHRSPVAANASAHTRATAQPATIEQVLAGRAAGNGLEMRWTADDAPLHPTWAGPNLAS